MKKNYITFLFLILTAFSFAQNPGDFQSASSGDWTNLNSWSEYIGATWVTPATNYPGQIGGTYEVTILAAHIIDFRTTSTILHSGILNILGTLNLNVTGVGNPDTINLNTTELNINGGNLNFVGSQVRLNLPASAVITITSGGTITAETCNNNNQIYIGGNKYASCVGGGANTYTFGEVVAAGGSVNASIIAPITGFSSEACATINIEGGYSGPDPDVAFRWILTDSYGFTSTLGSGTLANNTETNVDTFTPTVADEYLLSFEVTSGSFVNIETIVINVTVDATAPIASNPAPSNVQCLADVPAPNPLVVTDEADNCGTPTVTFVSQTANPSPNNGTITRTYRVDDGNGNTIDVYQDIVINDTQNPTATNPADINVQCLADVPAADPLVVTDEADNCGTPTVTFVSQTANPANNDGTITRTYLVDDGNGNTINVFQDIVIDDTQNPTATNPADINVQCLGDVPAADPLVVTDEADNCGTPTVTFISQTANPSPNNGTITRTYRVDDGNGNTIDVYQDIVINDTQNPTATDPADINVQCLADVPAADPLVVTDEADNCGTPTVTFISQTANPSPNNGTITRTYRVDDGNGNTIDVYQDIVIDDTQNPTATNPADINVQCLADVPAADPLVVTDEADNCGTPTVTFVSQTANPANNDGTITRTYLVDDGNGNTINVFQDIVIDDTQNPTATNPADINVQCLADVPAADPLVVTDEADNCGTPTVTFISQTANPSPNNGTITRTYRVDDGNGNTIDVYQDIVINDTQNPTATDPADINVQCLADVPAADPLVVTDEADNCGTPTVTFVSQTANPANNDGTITRTYLVDDGNGNTINVYQDIVINDTQNPTATDPADINVQCLADVPAADPLVVTDEADNCGTPTVTFVSQTANPANNDGTITRTYLVDDGNGNTIDVYQDIVINDTQNPTATDPADINVQCLADVPAPNPLVVTDEADNCGTPTVTFVSQTANPSPNNGTITRTYRVDDGNGNTIDVYQDIVINDTQNPTATNPADINVQCLADVPAADPLVVTDEADNCGTPTVTFVSQTANPANNDGTITRTYLVDDGNGNTINVFQDIVIDDTQNPTATNPADINVQCLGDVPAADPLVVTDEADNCGTPTVTFISQTANPSPNNGTITRTYRVDDGNGNTIDVYQDIVINDTQNPTATDPADINVQCLADVPAADPLVVTDEADNCGTPTVTFISQTANPSPNNGTITRTYRVDDGNGNTIDVYQDIVIDDTQNPTATNPADINVQCLGDVPAPNPLVVTDEADNCGTPTVTFVSQTANPANNDGTITRTYLVDDGNGNTINVFQDIVIDDTQNPTATNPADINVQCLADVPAADPLVVTDEADNCGTPTVTFISQTANPSPNNGTITRTYRVDDGNGNTIDVYQDIVIDDTQNPTATNPADINVQCLGDVPAPNPLVVTDEADNCGTPTVTFVSQTANPANNDGTITRTYLVDDGNGNTINVFQDIVIDDTQNPTATNPADINVQCLADVPAADPLVVTDEADNCGTPTVTFVSQTANPSPNNGTITRTYRVDDGNGNTIDVYQDIVINDTQNPTATDPADINVQCLADVPAADPLVVTDEADNCGTPTVTFVSQTANPANNDGTITRTYLVDDGNGNTINVYQDIVINDTQNPTATDPADINVQCLADVPAADPLVVTDEADNCGTPTVTFVSQTANPANNDGTITRTYLVDDGNGNTIDVYQDIVINDTQNPTATDPADINVQCLADVPAADPLVVTDEADNCGTPTVTFVSQTANPANNDGTITRTYLVDDGNGNTINVFQDIVIDDTQNPTATNPADINVQCLADVPAPNPLVVTDEADNCGTPTVTFVSQTANPSPNNGTITRTYRVDDGNGNTIDVYQTININDTTPPTITCPADVIVNANASCEATGVNLGTPTTFDNCGIASVTNDAPSSFQLGDTTVTWTITDYSGLSANCTQLVTVNDITAPIITCPGNQNVDFDVNCEFSLQDYTSLANTSDNCDNNNITVTQSPAPGAMIASTVTVTLTATDDGNNSTSCTFDVIPSDNLDPIAVCQNITVNLAANGTVNISPLDIENGSSDNCGIASTTVTPSSFNCGNVGDNTVTYTVYDNAGNSASCTATVTIVDATPPTMLCNDFVVVIDAITRVATIQASDVDNGSNDACGLASLTVSPNVFNEDPNGNVYIAPATLTATDINGNVNTCIVNVTVEPPKNQFTYLTGEIVNPIPSNPQPPSALIEATSCPGGTTTPRDVAFELSAIGGYTLNASDVNFWEFSIDNGETWTTIAGTAGTLTHTIVGLVDDTFVRLNITDYSDPANPITQTSAEAYVRFLPPEEPPLIVSHTALDICLGDPVTINAESYFDLPGGQFGEGGEFNYAQPDGWRVNYVDGDFPAAGDNGREEDWKETNSNNNALFSNINYDTSDNTKFALAHGVGNITQLETPVFSTIGMTSAEAIMTFDTSFYFCNGGYGTIYLSFDSGNTYTQLLTTVENHDFTSGNTTGVHVTKNGNCNSPNSQRASTNPRMVSASIDLGQYTGLSGLRVRFEFFGSSSTCNNVSFPPAPGNNCNPVRTFNVASGWAIDNVGFAYAQVDDELEWTDEEGIVIANGTTATVTPVTPGIREFGVTALVNGCRSENDLGTNFVNINTSLAYAGQDYAPLASQCGENTLQLNAYDNRRNAAYNFNKGAYETNLYVIPPGLDPVDANNFPVRYAGTGVNGQWSVVSATNTTCGTNVTFSSNTDPDAIFTADPGTYVLRWTIIIPNAGPNNTDKICSDDVTVTIRNCPTVNFDGVNDNITFRNNYNLNSPFSIEAWVKPNSVNGTRTVFSKKDVADNTAGYALSIVGGQVVFNWYNNSGTGTVTSGANSVGTDRWYHLAVTFDGAQYLLYVDGIQLGSANGSAPSQTGGNIEAIIGAMDQSPSSNSPTNYYHGWMDELKIWNNALSVEHIRQMMNQRIEQSGTDVIGTVIPLRIFGRDANQDGVEDNPLTWNDLEGYYRMTVDCGDFDPYKGVSGRMRNITTSQQLTAPLPYTSRVNGLWTADNTWTNFNVWDVPNSNGINGTPINWNIVRTSHNISSGDKDIIVLGLIVNSNELSIEDPVAPFNENNVGQMLWVTRYLRLDGRLDLVGESQLVQKRYNAIHFEGSHFSNLSIGYGERDQQGTLDAFNYNYFSSPFAPENATVNNENTTNTYSIGGVLRDGTTTVAVPYNRNIVWTAANTALGGDPTQVSTRWLYSYNNRPGNTYSEWEYLNNTGTLNIGLGFTMKGSGNTPSVTNTEQNYVFVGKPNNGTITNTVSPEVAGLANDILLGNPYSSSIDALEFIKDNIPFINPNGSSSTANSNSSESIDGSLYFWDHYDNGVFSHTLREYEGGYAVYNLTGGIVAPQAPPTEDGIIIAGGLGTTPPSRYIPVAQGFFVTGSPTGGLIKFENDQRAYYRENGLDAGNSIFFGPNTGGRSNSNSTSESNDLIQRIRLNFKSPEGAIRTLLIGFTPNNEADDGYNYGYDAHNYDDFPSDLSWSINNEKFIIQGVGAFDTSKKYPFILELGINGSFEISLTELENFDSIIDVYIYDAFLETYTKFNETPFEITMDAGDYMDRYYLAFINPSSLSIPEDDIDAIRVNYLNDTNEIYINWINSNDIKEVELINIIGQSVKTWTNLEPINSHEIKIPVKNISEGNYVIKVINKEGMTTNKKVIITQ